jgi:hypothetical protein
VELRCLAAGANYFISKPIDQNVLFAALKDLLDLTWIIEPPLPDLAIHSADGGLVYPPIEEMQVLRTLARTGNMRSVRERAEHLRRLDARYAAFAARLAALAEDCQSRAITVLVEGEP